MLRWIVVLCLVLLAGCQQCESGAEKKAEPRAAELAGSDQKLDSGPGLRITERQGKILSEDERKKAEATKQQIDAAWTAQAEQLDGGAYVRSATDPDNVHEVLLRFGKVKDRMGRLADRFEARAAGIRNALAAQGRYLDIQAPLDIFDELHGLHVKSLRNGDILIATNVLRDLIRFSYNFCGDHFKLRRIFEVPEAKIVPGPDFCRDGLVICLYLSGHSTCDATARRHALADYQNPLQGVALYEALLETLPTSETKKK